MSHTIRVYGDIGDSYYGEGVTAGMFAQALDAVPLTENQVDLRVNSFGGLTSDGLAMMNTLKAFSQKRKAMGGDFKIVCHVDGYAYSAASIFPLAADEVVMHGGTMLMIHNAWFHCSGDYREMQAAAGYLEKVSNELAKLYASKMGVDVEKVRSLLDAETFFTGEEAVAVKLANAYEGVVDDAAKAVYKGVEFNRSSMSYKQFMTAAKMKPRANEPKFKILKRDNDFIRLVDEFEKLISA